AGDILFVSGLSKLLLVDKASDRLMLGLYEWDRSSGLLSFSIVVILSGGARLVLRRVGFYYWLIEQLRFYLWCQNRSFRRSVDCPFAVLVDVPVVLRLVVTKDLRCDLR